MSLPLDGSSLGKRLRTALTLARKTAQSMLGTPDYEAYVAHRLEHHAGDALMSYEEFFRERQNSRYRKGSSRCC